MVFGFGHHDNEQHYDNVYNKPHEGSLGHEALGGAAAFFAMREYEKHQAANGHPPNHAFAKELLAGIAAAEVDKLVETKGLDYVDREKAKRHAREQAEQMYDQQHGNTDISGGGGGNWGNIGAQYGVGGGYGGQGGYGGGGGYGGPQEGYGGGGGGYGGPQGGYGGPQGGYGGGGGGYGGPQGGYGGPQGGYGGQEGYGDEGHHHHHHHGGGGGGY